jgi:hypothetical protein
MEFNVWAFMENPYPNFIKNTINPAIDSTVVAIVIGLYLHPHSLGCIFFPAWRMEFLKAPV